jgi:hypothetical protein
MPANAQNAPKPIDFPGMSNPFSIQNYLADKISEQKINLARVPLGTAIFSQGSERVRINEPDQRVMGEWITGDGLVQVDFEKKEIIRKGKKRKR